MYFWSRGCGKSAAGRLLLFQLRLEFDDTRLQLFHLSDVDRRGRRILSRKQVFVLFLDILGDLFAIVVEFLCLRHKINSSSCASIYFVFRPSAARRGASRITRTCFAPRFAPSSRAVTCKAFSTVIVP